MNICLLSNKSITSIKHIDSSVSNCQHNWHKIWSVLKSSKTDLDFTNSEKQISTFLHIFHILNSNTDYGLNEKMVILIGFITKKQYFTPQYYNNFILNFIKIHFRKSQGLKFNESKSV